MSGLYAPSRPLTYRWGVVNVEMSFFDTLAVITLWVRKTEKTLFQEVTMMAH